MEFIFEGLNGARIPLKSGDSACTPPRTLHHVEVDPGTGCSFKLQFYRDSDAGQQQGKAAAAGRTGVKDIDNLEAEHHTV